MELTRERKVAMGILGVALAALLVDRGLLLGGGQEAMAATSSSIEIDAPGMDVLLESSVGQNQLADRLQRVAEEKGLRIGMVESENGAFAKPDVWVCKVEKAAEEQDVELPRLVVTSVIMGSGGGFAVINGKLVPVGGSMAGVELVSVGRESARVRYGELEFDLAVVVVDGEKISMSHGADE